MEYINEVTLCGQVGNVVTKNNGVGEYTRFTLVTQCEVKHPDHHIVDVTWHSIISLTPLTILKGECVKVKGSLRTMRYVDKNGEDRYAVEIMAKEVELIKE